MAERGRVPASQVPGSLGLLRARHLCFTHPGQRGWRERRTLPFLSAALHGPPPQGRALHTDHGGHSKVRPHPGPFPGLCPPRASHLPSSWCPQGTGCAEGLRTRLTAAHPAVRWGCQDRHPADRGVSGGDAGATRVSTRWGRRANLGPPRGTPGGVPRKGALRHRVLEGLTGTLQLSTL